VHTGIISQSVIILTLETQEKKEEAS